MSSNIKKPTIPDLFEAIEIIEKSLESNVAETINFIMKSDFYDDFKRGLKITIVGNEYPEDLKARVIKVLAILENRENN